MHKSDLQKDPASGNRTIGGTAVEGAKPLFEKVIDKKEGDVKHPTTSDVVAPDFPFQVPHEGAEDATRRERLAPWMTDADNPYFARSYVNRLWGYLFGVGLIEPIDDIRAGNPPTNPELLDHLTASFVESGFDTRQMLRMICNSRTYQLSVETNPLNEDDSLNYSHALPRRLPAEVIYDAVHVVTGSVSNDSRNAQRHAGRGDHRLGRQTCRRIPAKPGSSGAGKRLRMRTVIPICNSAP